MERINKQTNVPDIAPYVPKMQSKSVNVYGLDGKYIKTFPSCSAAAKELHLKSSSISLCIAGKQKASKSYQFRIAE